MHLLAEMIAIPLNVVRELCKMVCGPTCHPVLEFIFEVSKAQGICAILILQDQSARSCRQYTNIIGGRGGEICRSSIFFKVGKYGPLHHPQDL